MSLIVSQLDKTFPGPGGILSILNGCSFELASAQSLSLTGPSGSGKSTLLGILGTLEPADGGSIRLDAIEVLSLTEAELPGFRRRKIGFIFQDHHLLPQCSAMENVLMPFLAEGRISDEQRNRAGALLDRVGLADRWNHRPAELSGGERQRVAVARALVYEPSLLLADEPTGNLDRASATQIADLLFELAGTRMLVLATHDPAIAERATRQMRLDNGKLVSVP